MKFRDIDRILRQNGFQLAQHRGKGSHRVYEKGRGAERRSVSVPFHGTNADIAPGTLSSVIRRSGLDRNRFR